jgi:hypothetical protein
MLVLHTRSRANQLVRVIATSPNLMWSGYFPGLCSSTRIFDEHFEENTSGSFYASVNQSSFWKGVSFCFVLFHLWFGLKKQAKSLVC